MTATKGHSSHGRLHGVFNVGSSSGSTSAAPSASALLLTQRRDAQTQRSTCISVRHACRFAARAYSCSACGDGSCEQHASARSYHPPECTRNIVDMARGKVGVRIGRDPARACNKATSMHLARVSPRMYAKATVTHQRRLLRRVGQRTGAHGGAPPRRRRSSEGEGR